MECKTKIADQTLKEGIITRHIQKKAQMDKVEEDLQLTSLPAIRSIARDKVN